MLHLVIFIPFLFALIIPLLRTKLSNIHLGWFVLAVPVLLFTYFISFLEKMIQGEKIHSTLNWIPSLDINFVFVIDGLSMLFSLLITGIGSLVVLYSIFYLNKKENLGHFYFYLLLFMGAMLGVVLSDNIFVLYMFWEFTSISSFLLIGFWFHREKSRYGALKSMLITVFGGLALFASFLLMSITTGSTSIREIILNSEAIINSNYFVLILILFLLGAFTKSAQFPFHTWLPDAMEAPTPVSAYLHSATMVKAGIYLVARFFLVFQGEQLFAIIVSVFGIVTLAWGSFMAVRQTDLKGILAFSTISQLGMIMAMLGFGAGYENKVAIVAAVFHIFNHATFKGSLFMVAGIIDHETGTRDIRRLGGLYTFMPITATLAFFGTFSMAGFPLPVFNGFLSKEMFFKAAILDNVLDISILIPILAVIGSIFTFVYSMILFFKPFTGKENMLDRQPHEAPIGLLVSPAILVSFIIIIGLLPNIISEPILAPAVSAINGEIPLINIHFWHGFTNIPIWMSFTVVVIGTLLFRYRDKWTPFYNVFPGRWSAANVYDYLVNNTFTFAKSVTSFFMTGSIRNYLSIILGFLIGTLAVTIYITDGFAVSYDDLAPITWPVAFTGITMVFASIATIFMKNRIAAILVLGVVGYGLSILFVFFKAPDLALTQLIIETVTVALFLLCFYHLPDLTKTKESLSRKTLNIVISLSAGFIVTIIAIASHSFKKFDAISEYFIETSVSLGGGHNIVNVILVDMRGLDTLFEITVLGIAALAIISMIKLRKKEEVDS
ncbi:Na+/H+ antiporter subunit A [Lottiidibacillus patelloidae]|uniref:Na+/H+ antiporter subunit A n=1 Tax=Lottiidibacillus patelloidae TaxID=2670334 RepID=A0A263BW25_9BACI|nr:Na+/H+ antiporter subunit A [Lottiidibacillus patelloidae]OZM57778.1 Na+/H+ antiporter subunit A [Lottiidibacillus patelloidae]